MINLVLMYNISKRIGGNILNKSLIKTDPLIYNLIHEEKIRQKYSLELIASENFTSTAVLECLGSVLTNKYSEGLPGKRYYGGNKYIDKIENLCINRALETYRLDKNNWGVNVQPYSGSGANMAVYNGLLNPHDRIMGLDLPSGGHLTHGFYTSKRKISATSKFFESMPYQVKEDGYIDYDELEKQARIFKPKLIICGYSAYPRDLDYERFRKIADINKSYLHCDMAHFSGLVATQEISNPFEYCDIITTTTHKTLAGPRAGMIFFKKEFETLINDSVFPGLQGGPHQNVIAAIATQLNAVQKPEFKIYIRQVKKNIKVFGEELKTYGYKLQTDGTDNHLLLVDLRPNNISGSKVERVAELVDISINKNSVPGDKSALSPGGIRVGSSSLTSRGFKEDDFKSVAGLLHEVIELALKIQNKSGKNMVEFEKYCIDDTFSDEIFRLKNSINFFASSFELYD